MNGFKSCPVYEDLARPSMQTRASLKLHWATIDKLSQRVLLVLLVWSWALEYAVAKTNIEVNAPDAKAVEIIQYRFIIQSNG